MKINFKQLIIGLILSGIIFHMRISISSILKHLLLILAFGVFKIPAIAQLILIILIILLNILIVQILVILDILIIQILIILDILIINFLFYHKITPRIKDILFAFGIILNLIQIINNIAQIKTIILLRFFPLLYLLAIILNKPATIYHLT